MAWSTATCIGSCRERRAALHADTLRSTRLGVPARSRPGPPRSLGVGPGGMQSGSARGHGCPRARAGSNAYWRTDVLRGLVLRRLLRRCAGRLQWRGLQAVRRFHFERQAAARGRRQDRVPGRDPQASNPRLRPRHGPAHRRSVRRLRGRRGDSGDAACQVSLDGTTFGGRLMFCHPQTNTCVLKCSKNADCPADWVCDTSGEAAASTGGQAICTAPQCDGT